MTAEQLQSQLDLEGLRLADPAEPGWAYAYIDQDGSRQSAWVTDAIPDDEYYRMDEVVWYYRHDKSRDISRRME